MFKYRFIVNKALTEFLQKRSLCSLVNFGIHLVPCLPSKLQKSPIDKAWESFEQLAS